MLIFCLLHSQEKADLAQTRPWADTGREASAEWQSAVHQGAAEPNLPQVGDLPQVGRPSKVGRSRCCCPRHGPVCPLKPCILLPSSHHCTRDCVFTQSACLSLGTSSSRRAKSRNLLWRQELQAFHGQVTSPLSQYLLRTVLLWVEIISFHPGVWLPASCPRCLVEALTFLLLPAFLFCLRSGKEVGRQGSLWERPV